MVIVGEIGLAGEIRGVRNVVQRVREAVKLGYKKIMLPAASQCAEIDKMDIEILYVSNISQVLNLL